MEYFQDETTSETREFIRHFDRFFDCMNVRCTSEAVYKRKPDLRPYRDPSDPRFSVSEQCVLMNIAYMYILKTLILANQAT